MRFALVCLFALLPAVAAAQGEASVELTGTIELVDEQVWIREDATHAAPLTGPRSIALAKFAGRQVRVEAGQGPSHEVLRIVSPAREVIAAKVVDAPDGRFLLNAEQVLRIFDPAELLDPNLTVTVDAWVFEDDGLAWIEAVEAETTATWTVFRKSPTSLYPTGFVRGMSRAVWITARQAEFVEVRRGRHTGWVKGVKVQQTAPEVDLPDGPTDGIIERLRRS